MMPATSRTSGSDGVRAMTSDELATVLGRMKLGPDANLTLLQWAFIKTTPFHNIALLAGTSPRTVDSCIKAVVDGHGGPCHVCATAFLALLRALGYRAHLAAATISMPYDHLVVVAHSAAGPFVCDVGNGHPYTHPFALHGRTTVEHLGWRFTAEGIGTELVLTRHLGTNISKLVYRVDPTPRSFDSFKSIIDKHHGTEGFGPFLTGLRAVLVREDLIVTLRDGELIRYSLVGARVRPVHSSEQALRVLERVFGLGKLPLIKALSRLNQRSIFSQQPSEPPTVIVSLSTTGRPDNLWSLLLSLGAEWSETQRKGCPKLRVLVVENSPSGHHRAENHAIVGRGRQQLDLDITLVDDGIYARPISASRARQTMALAQLYSAGEPFDVVWMLDDDLELTQLRLEGNKLHQTRDVRFFDRIADLYMAHPEASVLVGGVCGDPPIRPDAVLSTQLFDLTANLERFSSLDPDAVYHAPIQRASFDLPDYYYDHSRAGVDHLSTPFVWLGRTEGQTVREEALAFVQAMHGAFWGKTPTRPLLARQQASIEGRKTCLLRGGNTVFLDVDACFRHTYPSLEVAGVITRRADMVGATLLNQSGGTWVADFPYPVLHQREPGCGLSTPPEIEASRAAVLESIKSEHYGVLLARAIMDGPSRLLHVAQGRVNRLLERFCEAIHRAEMADEGIERARSTWLGEDAQIVEALDVLASRLDRTRKVNLGGMTLTEQKAWLGRVECALDLEMVEDVEVFVRTSLPGLFNSHREELGTVIGQKVPHE